ncbi:MAG: tetratricopeptide repeat protein [Planctomycetota bacterium]
MDSEHRHELKTNELAEWLTHLPELIKKNANMIIGVVLIAVGVITWPMFNKMSQKKEMVEQTEVTQTIQMLDKDIADVLNAPAEDPQAKADALDQLAVNVETLLERAPGIENPNLAALVWIKTAQAIRTELHLRKDVDAEILEGRIEKAKGAYEQAFATADTATLKATAQFGLGLCSEELGQTDQAAEIYRQIIDEESYKATVRPTQAQKRLDGLDENAEGFHFAAVPVIVEEAVAPIVEESTVTEETAEDTDTSQSAEETTEAQTQEQ